MVPKTRITRIFYIGDLRSGQFDGLAIISQWENMKLLILPRVRITSAYNYFRIILPWAVITIACASFCRWPEKMSFKVTKGHQKCFAYNFWLRRATNMGMVSLCLSHQATSTMCNMTCSGQRGSLRDLEVRSNFQIDLSKHVVYDSTRLKERNTMASQLFSYLSYMKLFSKNTINSTSMTSGV